MEPYTTTHLVFFSPTHTSAKIARAVGEGIGMGRRIETDLTLDEGTSPILINDALTVIAVPVYGGRVAPIALQRLKRLKGHNAPVILLTIYGNRDYEDALVELRDTAVELGFTPLSAGAFIGEHSYSRPNMPVAAGRPDADDLQKAEQFGRESLKKLQENTFPLPSFFIKGNIPYKPLPAGNNATPVCNDLCYACGNCIEVCPTHAIYLSADGSQIETIAKRCIRCCACVKECPTGARIFDSPFTAILHEKFSARREPETFINRS